MPMRRVHLSDDDLELLREACLSKAVGYAHDAERQRNPSVSDSLAASALKFERLAERLARFARNSN